MRARDNFWGSVITDDEVDALLRAHGEIDYTHTDGLDDAIAASKFLKRSQWTDWSPQKSFELDGDDTDLILLSLN